MAQCLARPANLSDPYLRKWTSHVIVPTYGSAGRGLDINNHFHDDAQPWLSASDGPCSPSSLTSLTLPLLTDLTEPPPLH